MTAGGLSRGEIIEPRTSRAAWLGTGLGARFRMRLVGILFAEVEGVMTFPLLRRTYVFDNPKEVVHTTPLLVPSSKLGLGLALP